MNWSESNNMSNANDFMDKEFYNLVNDIKKIALIPSPTFHEEKKRDYLLKCISEMRCNSTVDEAGNIIVALEGKSPKTIIYSAHMDTVFSENIKLELKEKDGKIFCPSICDNSTGLGSMICLMKYALENKISLNYNTIFLFNVCEEELGNLKGIRYFFDNFDKTKVHAHICIEGHQIGRLTKKVVGSHRRRITITCEGGHSWRDFGKPNAIQIAANLIIILSKMELLRESKTTFNIGTITGGTTVNAIPSSAEFTFEIRALQADILTRCVLEIDNCLTQLNIPDAKISSEILGERPCGEMTDSRIVEIIKAIHNKLGIETVEDSGSTDSNYPISLGLRSVTIGITEAEKTHSIDEFLVVEPIKKGTQQLIEVFEALNID